MNHQFQILKYLGVLVAIFVKIHAQLSPLQINSYDVYLTLDSFATNTYNLKINAMFTDQADITACFQQLTIQSSSSQTCNLQPVSSTYKCVRIYMQLSLNVPIWTNESFNFVINQNFSSSNENISVDNFQLQQRVVMTNVLQKDKIYHMLTVSSKNALLRGQWKQNYVHTYALDGYSNSLIMQRNSYCFKYKDKVILIMEGGVIRLQTEMFFIAILTIDINSADFSMWGGYSFSSDHAGRDMIGYQSINGDILDLYSIYASAPFQDTKSNIFGTDDVTQICSSSDPNVPQNSFHFIQFYRLYDSGDISGDQILRVKINNKHCFVGYFTTDQNAAPLPTNKMLMHQAMSCHQPSVQIYAINQKVCLFLAVLLIIFIL